MSLVRTDGLLGIPTDRATSDTAVKLSRDVADALESFKQEPIVTGEQYHESLADLERLAVECAREGWDGYGARPVDAQSVELARRMILALPSAFESPHVSAHPDGEVALTWQGARAKDFSVSISPSGQLSYAGTYGPSVVSYGSENFTDDLPPSILDHLRRLS